MAMHLKLSHIKFVLGVLVTICLFLYGVIYAYLSLHQPSTMIPKVFPPDAKYNALHMAAEHGRAEEIAQHLANTDVDSIDQYGNSALHRAAVRGSADLVKQLLDYGANPNLHNVADSTPLHYAIEHNKETVVKELLLHPKTDIEATQWGDTPLHVGVRKNLIHMVKMLLEARALVNPRNREGDTPLVIAARIGNVEMMKMLSDSDADWTARNEEKMSPFTTLVEKNSVASLQALITHFKRKNNNKNLLLLKNDITIIGNLLHYATKLNYAQMVRVLVSDGGIDINSRNNDGSTALFIAANEGWFAVAKELVLAGADKKIPGGCTLSIVNMGCKLPVQVTTSPEIKNLLKV